MQSETKTQKLLKFLFMIVYVTIITVTFSSDQILPKIASMVIIPIAFLVMLVRVDFENIKQIYAFPLCLAFSVLLIYLHSIVIWIINIEEAQYIMQGSQKILFQIINVLVAFSAVYIFGTKAIDYTLYGSVTINTYFFITSLLKHGVSASISDFFVAVRTGEQTGFMNDMEVQQLTYVYSFFIIYYLFISDYDKKKKTALIGLSTLYMILGFKRIIFAAVIVSLFCAVIFYFLPEKGKKPFAWIMTLTTAVCSFFYVYLIYSGLFEYLMNKLNVDTMGRIDVYNFMRPTYEFSPKFFGRGVEFVVRHLVEMKKQGLAVYNGVNVGVTLIHNDILVRYIEMGFFGFIGWLYFMCVFVFKWMKKHCGITLAGVYAAMNMCNFIDFSVGNTNRDYCVRLVIEVILFASIYKLKVEDENKPEKLSELDF